MLEQISQFFYDPLIFWGVPLVITLVWAGLRWARTHWKGRRDTP